ncbi:MAG: type II toxin-antitoxin system VapC family toxin [Rhizomicrobium sp.]
MTRFLLDTNILSDFAKPVRSASLIAWLGGQLDDDLFTSALSVAETWRGILILPRGKRRTELERWFAGPDGPASLFAGRILPFDARAALVWAELMAEGRAQGKPRNALDMIVAAVAQANDCMVVTDNEKDFAGVEIFNPMRDGKAQR